MTNADNEISSRMTPPLDEIDLLKYENELLRAYISPRSKGEYQPVIAYRIPQIIKTLIDDQLKAEGDTMTSFINKLVVKHLVNVKRNKSRKVGR